MKVRSKFFASSTLLIVLLHGNFIAASAKPQRELENKTQAKVKLTGKAKTNKKNRAIAEICRTLSRS